MAWFSHQLEMPKQVWGLDFGDGRNHAPVEVGSWSHLQVSHRFEVLRDFFHRQHHPPVERESLRKLCNSSSKILMSLMRIPAFLHHRWLGQVWLHGEILPRPGAHDGIVFQILDVLPKIPMYGSFSMYDSDAFSFKGVKNFFAFKDFIWPGTILPCQMLDSIFGASNCQLKIARTRWSWIWWSPSTSGWC